MSDIILTSVQRGEKKAVTLRNKCITFSSLQAISVGRFTVG